MISKKGELTTNQIVVLIILIASFAVILFFLLRLNLGEESEKEVCHNSVVLRSNDAIPTDSVPLNCQTTYVCITKDGSCEKLLKPQKEKVKTPDEIYSVLARELADCWWMFGEGGLNYIGSDTFKEMYCVRCSQISFDDSVKEISGFKNGFFDREELYKYMANTKISSDETYSEYIYGTNNYNAFLNVEDGKNVEFGDFDMDKQYQVVTGMTSETSTWTWVAVGAGAAVLGVVTFGLAIPVAILVIGTGGATGYFVLAPVVDNIFGGRTILPTLVRTDNEEWKQLGCENIATKS